MNISGRCDYACRAMLELATRYESATPVSAQTIAAARNIPEKYLTQIMLQLKRAGLVHSVRGAQGGYTLAGRPNKLSVLQIIEAVDGPVLNITAKDDAGSSEITVLWNAIGRDISTALNRFTLAKMLDMISDSTMFHI